MTRIHVYIKKKSIFDRIANRAGNSAICQQSTLTPTTNYMMFDLRTHTGNRKTYYYGVF